MSVEYVILAKRECFAYQVKAVAAGGGFKAAEWDTCVWKGRLQVCMKDETLIVKLVSRDGDIFAACPMTHEQSMEFFIQRTADSSRYFVLKLTAGADSSKRALLGFGFEDRNDAFDFNATILDFFAKKTDQTAQLPAPKRDFTLKSGEKIAVKWAAPAQPAPPAFDDLFGDFQAAPSSAGPAPSSGPALNLLD